MINRRKFIGYSITGLSGLLLSAHAFPKMSGKDKNKKLGVALVGLGYYSTDVLAPALQMTDHCYLAGIVTGTPSKIGKWQDNYGIPDKNVYNYENFDTIADNPDIDVVYVVLPPSMHAEYSIRAANAGKHVWCEKPMAMTVEECSNMINTCKKNNVKLSIGYRLQHEPNTQQIIRFRKAQAYGKVEHVIAAAGYYDSRTNHWKQTKELGGGAMYDMGVYPINAVRYSTGLEPTKVIARQSTNRPEIYTEVDETMEFDLEFPGGVTAKCETSFGKRINSLEVHCSDGWYKLSPYQSYRNIKGITSDGQKLGISIPNQQALQMDNDSIAIINDTPVLVPGEEGLKDIRVVEAVYRSVAENRQVNI